MSPLSSNINSLLSNFLGSLLLSSTVYFILKTLHCISNIALQYCMKKVYFGSWDVVCEPDEVFDFVDVEDDLSMCKDAYLELMSRSS